MDTSIEKTLETARLQFLYATREIQEMEDEIDHFLIEYEDSQEQLLDFLKQTNEAIVESIKNIDRIVKIMNDTASQQR